VGVPKKERPYMSYTKKSYALNIPDEYQFMDQDLIDVLISTVSEYIEIPMTLDE
jgi:predicted protein tyrosine phosphatase